MYALRELTGSLWKVWILSVNPVGLAATRWSLCKNDSYSAGSKNIPWRCHSPPHLLCWNWWVTCHQELDQFGFCSAMSESLVFAQKPPAKSPRVPQIIASHHRLSKSECFLSFHFLFYFSTSMLSKSTHCNFDETTVCGWKPVLAKLLCHSTQRQTLTWSNNSCVICMRTLPWTVSLINGFRLRLTAAHVAMVTSAPSSWSRDFSGSPLSELVMRANTYIHTSCSQLEVIGTTVN